MTKENIIEILSDCKSEIERRCKESSSYFYDDIYNEEMQYVCDTYPQINALSASEFQNLWSLV